MKRTLVRLLILTCVLSVAAAAIILMRSNDPAYRLRAWCALGRYEQHDPLIRDIAAKHGLDPNLVKAIAWRESALDSQKLHAGARGLMQLGEGTGIEWAAAHGIETFMVTDLFDPHTNLSAGCWYLSRVLSHWRHCDDPVTFALAEYHAGREAVQRWAGETTSAANLMRAIDAIATREFVSEILRRQKRYAEGS